MIFEVLMLFCFGAAWPVSVYKTYKATSVEGKSPVFIFVIMLGYFFGILYKYNTNFDRVTFLYIFNFIIIMTDLTLTIKKKRKNKLEKELKEYEVKLSKVLNKKKALVTKESVEKSQVQ